MARHGLRDLSAAFQSWPRALRIVVPIALGGCMALGHEGWLGGYVFVIAGLVLAFLMVPQPAKAAGFFGWRLGLGYFAVTLRWIVEPFLVDVSRHGWMAPFAIILMAGGLALFWLAAFWVARWVAGQRAAVVLWLPVTLGAMELARGHVLSGFPWGLPSYTLIGGFWDVWFAWIGPYGATVLLLGITGAVAFGLLSQSKWIWAVVPLVCFTTFGLHLYGATTQGTSSKTVRLIQPNAPQNLKWDRDWMGVFFDRALDQTRAGDVPDVVIWPETSVPTLLEHGGPLFEQMAQAARGAPVVAGLQRRTQGSYYNSAILIEEPDSIADISDKAHLVPFGEYIPLAWLLEPVGLGTLVEQVAGFSAGTGDGTMQIDGLGLVRVLICYEGIFPEEIWRAGPRPDVLLIITNDAWFGANAGPRQHLVQAQARAIEQGLPVIRAANTGISAVINPQGRITASLPVNEAGYLDALVPVATASTVYSKIGDWPLALLLFLVTMGGVVIRCRFIVDRRG